MPPLLLLAAAASVSAWSTWDFVRTMQKKMVPLVSSFEFHPSEEILHRLHTDLAHLRARLDMLDQEDLPRLTAATATLVISDSKISGVPVLIAVADGPAKSAPVPAAKQASVRHTQQIVLQLSLPEEPPERDAPGSPPPQAEGASPGTLGDLEAPAFDAPRPFVDELMATIEGVYRTHRDSRAVALDGFEIQLSFTVTKCAEAEQNFDLKLGSTKVHDSLGLESTHTLLLTFSR